MFKNVLRGHNVKFYGVKVTPQNMQQFKDNYKDGNGKVIIVCDSQVEGRPVNYYIGNYCLKDKQLNQNMKKEVIDYIKSIVSSIKKYDIKNQVILYIYNQQETRH